MRTIKIAVWILALYIIENVFGKVIAVGGTVTDLMLAFVISYSFSERRFKPSAYVILICSVLNGVGVGRIFPIAFALTGFAGILAQSLNGSFRSVPGFVRVGIFSALTSFVMCCCEYFVTFMKIDTKMLLTTALPFVISTAVATAIIYIILEKTMFKDKERRLLITNERD